MKLRVYLLPNWDGVRRAVVAAPNQREAARLLHTSVGHFRDYGGHRTTDPALVALAESTPGQVWTQRIDPGPNPPLWRPGKD